MSKKMVDLWTGSTLVAALGSAESAWFDIGKRAPRLDVTRTSTGGTYAFEVDWSRDGGSTTAETEAVATTAGVTALVSSKARWCRFRVKNTHASTAFSAHSTQVKRDAGTSV